MRFVRRHKRGLLALLIVSLLVTATWAADTKLSALGVLGSADVGDDDAIYIVDDPNGAATSYKVGRGEFLLGWAGSANITTLGTIATGVWGGTFSVDIVKDTDIDWGSGAGQVDLADVPGGTAGASAFDFGGATSVELPNAADPDLTAMGQVAIDSDGANEANDVTMRVTDTGGDTQYALAQVLKTIQVTLISPDGIDAADLIPIWHNNTGMTFNITEWHAWSDTDNVSFELEELTDATDFTAITQIDACEVATNGTSVYYASDTTITHAAVEHDHLIAIDFDATDTPNYLKVTITGWFNADVN